MVICWNPKFKMLLAKLNLKFCKVKVMDQCDNYNHFCRLRLLIHYQLIFHLFGTSLIHHLNINTNHLKQILMKVAIQCNYILMALLQIYLQLIFLLYQLEFQCVLNKFFHLYNFQTNLYQLFSMYKLK